MKVNLVHIDGKMPNLALLKLSAHYKKQGAEVSLNGGKGDLNFVSCIFERNKERAETIAEALHAELGGVGVGNGKVLADDIEHTMPDYSLYNSEISMGFTSRGCIRKCPYCIVPQIEGQIRDHAEVREFWNPAHCAIILLDNNFFAAPSWRDRAKELDQLPIEVNFHQGNDIRLIGEEEACWLAKLKVRNHTFKTDSMHFAFDFPEIEPAVRRGVKVLSDAGIKPRRLMFYILVGFNTSFEQDYERYAIVRSLGCEPYIMIYDNLGTKQLHHFARWVDRRRYKVCDWEDYWPWRKVKDQLPLPLEKSLEIALKSP